VALSVGARAAEKEPPEKSTTIGAPVTRQPVAALNGPTACIEHDPESGSPAGSVIVPVTVVVCAAAALAATSNSRIMRVSLIVIFELAVYE
jgi:hypothetical protein